jgi:hypothetical protein
MVASLASRFRHRLNRWVEQEATSGTWRSLAGLHFCEALTGLPLIGAYAHALAGAICQSAGRDEKAIAHYEASLTRGRSHSAGVHYSLGLAYLRAKDPTSAEHSLRRALELAPEEEWPYGRLAECLLAMDRLADAEEVVRMGMSLHADSLWLQQLLVASGFRRLGIRSEESIDATINAAAADKLDAASLPAAFSWHLFRPAMATPERYEALRRIVDRYPESVEARLFLARMDYSLGRDASSTAWLQQASALRWPSGGANEDVSAPRLPTFLVIGQPKSGTTSLYQYLCMHDDFRDPLIKEPCFWSSCYEAGLDWYSNFFPPLAQDAGQITGEASVIYFACNKAADRIATHMPHIRLIVLLRDPVDRAYSHYWMNIRTGDEFRNWEDVVNKDLTIWPRCPVEPDEIGSDMHLSVYLKVSAALPHLKRWLSLFPREQILILRSSDLAMNLQGTLDQVCAFIGLAPFVPKSVERVNVGSYPPMAPEIERRLRTWFEPHERERHSFLSTHGYIH